MCIGCWENEYGAPKIDSHAVREAARLIAEVYEHCSVGGGLHVIIDDFNMEDPLTRYTGRDDNFSAEEIATEDRCLAALRALTVEERASALALHDGYWS